MKRTGMAALSMMALLVLASVGMAIWPTGPVENGGAALRGRAFDRWKHGQPHHWRYVMLRQH